MATIKLKSSIIKSSSHDEDHWINSKGVLGSSWWSGAVASFCRTVCLHWRSKDFGWEQEFSFRVIKNKSTRQNNHTSGFKWVKISTGNPISKCQSMVSCYSGESKLSWNILFSTKTSLLLFIWINILLQAATSADTGLYECQVSMRNCNLIVCWIAGLNR